MRFVPIKINKTIYLTLLFAMFYCTKSFSDNLITILNPVESTTLENELFLEGKTEESFIKSLEICIEPFISKETTKTSSKKINVNEGYFSEKITLSTGLNLVRILTLNGKELRVIPIFYISTESNLLDQEQNLGSKSPILFAIPSEVKIDSTPCEFRGIITDPKLKSLDVVILDAMDLTSTRTIEQKQEINYIKPQIVNQQFVFSAKLNPGLNIILAKPYRVPAKANSIQIKSLIYEKTSPYILLNEPKIKDNKLHISGKMLNKVYGKVIVKISCLAAKDNQSEKLFYQTILNKTVDAQSDGTFNLILPWESKKKDYIIKAFPTIYIYVGNELATKTITEW